MPIQRGLTREWSSMIFGNTLRLRQNGRHFVDDIWCIVIKISLKFVTKSPFNNTPVLVQKMSWLTIIGTNGSGYGHFFVSLGLNAVTRLCNSTRWRHMSVRASRIIGEQSRMFLVIQRAFCICAQLTRDNVIMERRLSLAGGIHKMIPGIMEKNIEEFYMSLN